MLRRRVDGEHHELVHLADLGGEWPVSEVGRPAVAAECEERKIGVGLIASLAAREVIVGTLGTIYGIEGTTQSVGLQAALRQDLTPGGAAALLVFFAFAMQCMSTVAVVRRELIRTLAVMGITVPPVM